ncbi:unnamed protein product [Nezara viridula]|uniref:Lipocalin/cytosolic fatty-acid binding domain-containing protein n=1 Tax=Nezara viridula TaxID=85310 RepID=A0A9P0HG16_NEZVI|nr:unnamed protein product [Nezara viridula]
MKAYTIVLAFAVFSFTKAINCPTPQNLPVKEIDYQKFLGEWIMLANKPEWNERCKNITVKNTTNNGNRLHVESFKKQLHFWRKHSIKDYDVVKHLKPTSILELKNRSWYSLGTLNLQMIAADYEQYVVLYNCHKEIFFLSEIVEIWGRRDLKFSSDRVPKEIRDVLAKFKISSADLRYRKPEDCWL